jgi:hypothetical protein
MMHLEDILNEDKDVVVEEYYDEFDDYYHVNLDKMEDYHDEELLLMVDDMLMMKEFLLVELVYHHVIDVHHQMMFDL